MLQRQLSDSFCFRIALFLHLFSLRKQQKLFLRDTFCFSTAPEIGSSCTITGACRRDAGTTLCHVGANARGTGEPVDHESSHQTVGLDAKKTVGAKKPTKCTRHAGEKGRRKPPNVRRSHSQYRAKCQRRNMNPNTGNGYFQNSPSLGCLL